MPPRPAYNGRYWIQLIAQQRVSPYTCSLMISQIMGHICQLLHLEEQGTSGRIYVILKWPQSMSALDVYRGPMPASVNKEASKYTFSNYSWEYVLTITTVSCYYK